jgi:hypothetical protein
MAVHRGNCHYDVWFIFEKVALYFRIQGVEDSSLHLKGRKLITYDEKETVCQEVLSVFSLK